jgi:FMN phosphatase YigB (HAD superfamily)
LFVIDLDDTLAHTTRDLGGDTNLISRLTLVQGAMEFLREHGRHSVLLSAGDPFLQHRKLKYLNIYEYFPRKVYLYKPESKTQALADIVAEAGCSPSGIAVIGDRLDLEIAVGNKLGCTTVRVRLEGGKHSHLEPGLLETPTYTVADFVELMQLPIFPNPAT